MRQGRCFCAARGRSYNGESRGGFLTGASGIERRQQHVTGYNFQLYRPGTSFFFALQREEVVEERPFRAV
jgi:hypothetical protein